MDGATNELAAAGYGRSGELRMQAERAAKRWAQRVADDLHIQSRVTEQRWRGLSHRCAAWPEQLFERWAESVESYGIGERDVIEMREPFMAQAALTLEHAGYDCR